MKEEDIKQKFGCGNPFTVPEGYFEQLTTNIMAQLPDSPQGAKKDVHKPMVRKWRIRLMSYAAAACVCGLMLFGVSSMMNRHHLNTSATASSHPKMEQYTDSEEEYINEALDYAMVSNQEIALYLTDVY